MGSSDELVGAEGPRPVGTQQAEAEEQQLDEQCSCAAGVWGPALSGRMMELPLVYQPVTHTRTPSVYFRSSLGSAHSTWSQMVRVELRGLRNGECRCFYDAVFDLSGCERDTRTCETNEAVHTMKEGSSCII